MTDNDTISYDEYQKLPKEEKQNFETHWNSDGKSGYATRKGTKLPEAKSTIPVNGIKAAEPDKKKTVLSKEEAAKAGIKTSELPTQFELEHPTLSGSNRNVSDENGWIDNDGNVHLNSRANEAHNKAVESDRTADAETKGKTETTNNRMSDSSKAKTDQMSDSSKAKTDQMSDFSTDKANQMSDSSKAKTDTTATGKFINPFQKEKEAADKAVEDASILLDRVKQLETKIAKKRASSINWNTFSPPAVHNFGKELLELDKETEALAKELGIDISSLSVKDAITITPLRLEKIKEELIKAAEERLAATKTKQQETQANYTKVEEILADKRKAESKPAPKAPKAQKAETETEKAETEEPLKKAEELEQPQTQTPTDIKKFSKDLNRFVIQAYLNGDFGKRSSPNAIASMGFFILDKIGTALVNASQVARGNSPSAKSQWSKILDKQTELLGKRITAEWLMNLPKEKLEALYRSGALQTVTGDDLYGATDPNAVSRAAERDALRTSKLSQEQKGVAQSNVNALLARKSELQTLIAQLRSDQGWEVYTQAMNATVGTAKGLNTLGITDDSSSSSNKGFSDTLSADVKTGKVTAAFVSGGISNSSSWNNSSAESLSKSNSLNQDALALSKFKSGEEYAKASREAKKAANEQLIERLEKQIEIIDKCIDSWGKDLDL